MLEIQYSFFCGSIAKKLFWKKVYFFFFLFVFYFALERVSYGTSFSPYSECALFTNVSKCLNGGISMQIDLMLYAYDTRIIDSLHAIGVQSMIPNNSLEMKIANIYVRFLHAYKLSNIRN